MDIVMVSFSHNIDKCCTRTIPKRIPLCTHRVGCLQDKLLEVKLLGQRVSVLTLGESPNSYP